GAEWPALGRRATLAGANAAHARSSCRNALFTHAAMITCGPLACAPRGRRLARAPDDSWRSPLPWGHGECLCRTALRARERLPGHGRAARSHVAGAAERG